MRLWARQPGHTTCPSTPWLACAGFVDAGRYLHYHARTDDMIISSGCNIASPGGEDALLTHLAVAECGVAGAADEARSQIVNPPLRPGHGSGDAMTRAVQDFVKKRIAPYKYPRAVAHFAALPRIVQAAAPGRPRDVQPTDRAHRRRPVFGIGDVGVAARHRHAGRAGPRMRLVGREGSAQRAPFQPRTVGGEQAV